MVPLARFAHLAVLMCSGAGSQESGIEVRQKDVRIMQKDVTICLLIKIIEAMDKVCQIE